MVNSGERNQPQETWITSGLIKPCKRITWGQEVHSAEWWPTYCEVNDQFNGVTMSRGVNKKKDTFPKKRGPGALSQESQPAPERPRLACQSLTKKPRKVSKAKITDGQRAWSWICWSRQECHQTICSQLRWAAMPLSVYGKYGGQGLRVRPKAREKKKITKESRRQQKECPAKRSILSCLESTTCDESGPKCMQRISSKAPQAEKNKEIKWTENKTRISFSGLPGQWEKESVLSPLSFFKREEKKT